MAAHGSVASIASVMRAAVKMTPASLQSGSGRNGSSGIAAALVRVKTRHEKQQAKVDVTGADKHIARVRSSSPDPNG